MTTIRSNQAIRYRIAGKPPPFARRGIRFRFAAGSWPLTGWAILLAARLTLAALTPLTEDEAYYRLWSQHLQFGYFDHPPMIAWWLALGRCIGGDSPFGDRLLAVLASMATTALVFDVARLAGWSPQIARRAALWYAAAPLVGFGAILILPDAALSLFWMLTLWALLKVRPDARSWWVVAGAAAGAATLSKYSALFLGVAALGWLLSSPQGRRELRSPWPWAAAATAAAVFLPNLVWNQGQHWATFIKQFGRLTPNGFTPWGLAGFIAALAVLINPLVLPFLVRGAACVRALGHDRRKSLMLVSVVPFLGYLCLHSLHGAVQAHWPAPIYGALAILAAAGAASPLSAPLRVLRSAAPWVGIAVSTLALVHLAAPVTDRFGPRDPARPVRGWDAFADRIETLRRSTGAHWVGAVNYGTAAQLAAVWRSPAPLLQVTERARYSFAPPVPALDGAGLIVDLERRMATASLADCFRQTHAVGSIFRGLPDGPMTRYSAVLVDGAKRNVIVEGCRTFHNGHADVWP